MRTPGRAFKVFISFLLIGIFFELLTLIGILSGEDGGRGNIGVVELIGEIDDPRPTVDALKKYKDNDKIKAIVLRVDSPGGPVGSSQEIHDAVIETNKSKKVIVSMGNLAASGGYYISVGATKIVADPGTITGSIGVIAHFFVLDDLLRRAHVKWEVIKAGEVKDMGSPLRSITPKERALLQGMTDDMHNQFIEAVANGRKLPIEKVRVFADGRVFSGRQALSMGLVDSLGNLSKAIQVAADLVHIRGEPKAVYPKREHFGWLKRISEGKIDTPIFRAEYRFAP